MDSSRHGLFRYLTADETAGYLAIMDLFPATLLTDPSAVEARRQTPPAVAVGPRPGAGLARVSAQGCGS